MFIAMNRFKIKPGCEQDFIAIWEGRDTFLQEVPGFKSFNLLQGPSTEEYTLFSSHATWESREAFEGWTRSDAFRKAHANACLLYTSPSPRDDPLSRMPSSA